MQKLYVSVKIVSVISPFLLLGAKIVYVIKIKIYGKGDPSQIAVCLIKSNQDRNV